MTIDKLVSVGVAAYNEADCIKECLESIAADGYPHKEIIISDNGSTDSTWEIIERFKNEYEDAYDIHIIRQGENRGAIFNFNYVLKHARGEYFAWVGAHDAWGPDFVAECVAMFEGNRDAALVMPLVKWISDDSNVLEVPHSVIDTSSAESPVERVLLLIDQWKECTAIYGLHRKSILLNTLPWPRTIGADNLALVRIAKQGNIIPAKLTCYFRRARSPELPDARVYRQLRALNLKGTASRKPRTTYELRLFFEAIFVRGPPRYYARLIVRVFHRLVAAALLENCPVVHSALKRIKVRLLT